MMQPGAARPGTEISDPALFESLLLQAEKVRREEVERLAHQVYLERGGVEGHALDDWLEAERKVAARWAS